jgi:hypothetical protein
MRPLPRRSWLVTSVGSALILAACSGPGPSATPINSEITAELTLSRTGVEAGHADKGFLVIHNPGPTINLTTLSPGIGSPGGEIHCEPKFVVTLSGNGISQQPAFPADCVDGPLLIWHGTTKLRATVYTTYTSCTGDTVGVSRNNPRCDQGTIPPLPLGNYRTRIQWSGTALVPQPRSLTVTLNS